MLRDGPLLPACNMARDEALLHEPGPPVLRFYDWHPVGLSIGRFQDVQDFADVADRYQVVRRITGGGAILHEHEITFALALDADVLPANVADAYVLIHGAAVRALAEVGVQAMMLPGDGRPVGPRPTERWCFASPGAHDVVLPSGRKILGSAQRRLGQGVRRVLHHGSLVLQAPTMTPFCGAVADQVDPELVKEPLVRALIRHFSEALRLSRPGL